MLRWRAWKFDSVAKFAATSAFASILLYTLITSSHFLANPLHPSVSRLYMLPAVAMVALVIQHLRCCHLVCILRRLFYA